MSGVVPDMQHVCFFPRGHANSIAVEYIDKPVIDHHGSGG